MDSQQITFVTLKVLEYLQKTKTSKITFFLGKSFVIGLKSRQNLFLLTINEIKASFITFFHVNVFQVKLDNIFFLFKFNLTSH